MPRKSSIQTIDTAELREQAAALGQTVSERAQEAGKTASVLAQQGIDWATPRIEAAKEWATPRVEQAWREGVKAAAPRIEAAAGAVRPAVDVAHDKIVDEYLPKLVAAVNAAADRAEARVSEKIDEIAEAAQNAVADAPRSHPVRNTFGWVFVGAVVVGAGYLLWKRTKPIDDPWAEEYWDDTAEVAGASVETPAETPAAEEKPSEG